MLVVVVTDIMIIFIVLMKDVVWSMLANNKYLFPLTSFAFYFYSQFTWRTHGNLLNQQFCPVVMKLFFVDSSKCFRVMEGVP